jgi:uncharacterized protein VirK/YbjX
MLRRDRGRGSVLFLGLFLNALRQRDHLKSLFDRDIAGRKITRYSRLILNLGEHRKILELLKDGVFSDIPKLQPAFPFKFLHERLICQRLSTKNKVRCLLTNFTFMKVALVEKALKKILAEESFVLFENKNEDSHLSIVFCLSNPIYIEGEMSLLFRVDGIRVFILSFTIVPGDVVNCPEPYSILISRLQGVKGTFAAFDIAAKTLGVNPRIALLEALQGVARAFRIAHLSAVPGAYQSSYIDEFSELYQKAYDQFFAANGMSVGAGRFFQGLVPLAQTSTAVSRKNPSKRRRRQMRREKRKEIADAVHDLMARNCRTTNGMP